MMHLRFGSLLLSLVALLFSVRATNSTIESQLACGHDFFEADGSCFHISRYVDVWDNAEAFCLTQGAKLVHSLPFVSESFMQFSNNLSLKLFWVHKDRPQVSGALRNCTVVDTTARDRVFLMDCNSRLPYVCRRDLWTFGGACPKGFFGAGAWCYRVFGSPLDRVQADQADEHCKRAGGRLAEIVHMVQLAAIRSHMEGRAQVDVLVKLSPAFLLQQRANIAWERGSNHHRVLGMQSVMPGSISDAKNEAYGYVCETRRVRVKLSGATQRTFSGPWASQGCPGGFVSFGDLSNLCLRLQTEAKSWAEARRQCRALGADLVSVVSEFEQANMLLQRVMTKADVWLGLKNEAWSDGSHSAFSLLRDDGKGCRAVTLEGAWRAENCSRRLPFLCAVRQRPPPEVIDVTRMCAFQNASLFQFRGFCYKIMLGKPMTREAANHYCASSFKFSHLSVSAKKILDQYTDRKSLGFVLEVESKQELAFAIQLMLRRFPVKDPDRILRSLWVEKTDNYVGWPTIRRASDRFKAHCIVSLMNGEWENRICTERHYLVCKTPTIPSGVVKVKKETSEGKGLKLYILTLAICFGVLFMFVVVCASWLVFKRLSSPNAQLMTDAGYAGCRPAPATATAKTMSQLLEEPPPDGILDDVYEEMDPPETQS